MKYAVIDCESNGLPDYTRPADDPCQPRLASLGIVMMEIVKYEELSPSAAEANGNEGQDIVIGRVEHEFLVLPDGWVMTEETTEVNGLTTDRLMAEGEPVSAILGRYHTLIESGYAIAAYGAQHDCKILRGESRRAGIPDRFEITKNVCLMRACQPLHIPKANGKGGWPQLSDACRFFKVPEEPKPHGALNGARAAAGILIALHAMSALPEPSVHFAKETPEKPAKAKQPQTPKPVSKLGDTKSEGGVDLVHNGVQFVPVVNAANYPKLFNEDGTRKEA